MGCEQVETVESTDAVYYSQLTRTTVVVARRPPRSDSVNRRKRSVFLLDIGGVADDDG